MAPESGTNLVFRNEIREKDVAAIEEIVASTGFFSHAEIRLAVELVEERLQKGASSGYFFLFSEDQMGRVLGYACYGPAPATQSTFELHWIAVHRDAQRYGLGQELLARTEAAIAAAGGVDVYVDTSSRALYQPTQTFYARSGYRLVAEFPDYYAPGDGRLVYVKRLR